MNVSLNCLVLLFSIDTHVINPVRSCISANLFSNINVQRSFSTFFYSLSSNTKIEVSGSNFFKFLDSSIKIMQYNRDFSSQNSIIIHSTKFEECQTQEYAGGALMCYNLDNFATITCSVFIKCFCGANLVNPSRDDYSGGSIAYAGNTIIMRNLFFDRSGIGIGAGRSFGGYSNIWNISHVCCLQSYGSYCDIAITIARVETSNLNCSRTQEGEHSGYALSYDNPYSKLLHYHYEHSGGKWSHHYNILDDNSISLRCNFVNVTEYIEFFDLMGGGGIIQECYFGIVGNTLFSYRMINTFVFKNCYFKSTSFLDPCDLCKIKVKSCTIYCVIPLCKEKTFFTSYSKLHSEIAFILFWIQ